MKYLKNSFLVLIVSTCCSQLGAQTTFLERLQRKIPGKANVTIYQDATITALVNAGQQIQPIIHGKESLGRVGKNGEKQDKEKKYKIKGYRIQIYAGGNSRRSKSEAERAALQCRNYFPELAVYTHFIPPRWICRLGDFRSYEEANAYIQQMRERNIFREASVVRSIINVSTL